MVGETHYLILCVWWRTAQDGWHTGYTGASCRRWRPLKQKTVGVQFSARLRHGETLDRVVRFYISARYKDAAHRQILRNGEAAILNPTAADRGVGQRKHT